MRSQSQFVRFGAVLVLSWSLAACGAPTAPLSAAKSAAPTAAAPRTASVTQSASSSPAVVVVATPTPRHRPIPEVIEIHGGAPPATDGEQDAVPGKHGARAAEGAFGNGGLGFPDGITVKVSQPTRFTPGRTSQGLVRGQLGVKMTLTVTNGRGKVFNAQRISMSLTYATGKEFAHSIVDKAAKITCSFEKKIPGGATKAVECGFSVPRSGLQHLQAQVALGDFVDSQQLIFTGSAR